VHNEYWFNEHHLRAAQQQEAQEQALFQEQQD
jgi:hypothetical protein